MSKDPAFLFYSQDFFTGVATLNWEDRGKYITLLCLMHQQGRMSEETIRFLVGSVSDNLKSKFGIDENGLWFNKRLEEESEKRSKFTESRRNNGSLGGRPKKEDKPKQNLKVNHMDNHMEDVNENENEVVIETKKGKREIEIPPYSEFLEYAKSKKPNLDSEHLNLKYQAWVEDGWKDGNGKPIRNWRSKLLQTLPHIKDVKMDANQTSNKLTFTLPQ
jgi:hypothetical protein